MSADLFAEFASPSTNTNTSKPSQATHPQSSQPTKPAVDPFAFLFSPSSQTSSPQTFQSPAQPWPSIPPQRQEQQFGSNSWGNIGSNGAAVSAPQQAAQETVDDDDGWGDFEEASSSTVTNPPASVYSGRANPSGIAEGPQTQPLPPARTRILRADTFALMSNSLVGLHQSGNDIESWPHRPSEEKTSAMSSVFTSQPTVPKPKPNDSNSDVLFDADDFDGEPLDEDDEFGDFETVEAPSVKTVIPAPAPASVPAQTAMADLLSLDFEPPAQSMSARSHVPPPISTQQDPPSRSMSALSLNAPVLSPNAQYPLAPRSPSFSDRNPFPGLAVTTPLSGTMSPEMKFDVKEQEEPTPVTAWPGVEPAAEKSDYFDAFADFPPDATSATPGAVSSSWDWDTVDSPEPQIPPQRAAVSSPRKVAVEEPIGLPPTNVPPPSILLSIFSELLEEVDTKLYQPTANQAPGVKSRIYADPATLDYLRGYLVLATVAARILAGRKLRWHRDKFLSQAMTISAAGAKGGMKLTGIDKTQAAREDREAADVVGVWRDHVGKLRSAVAAANIGIQKQPMKLEPLKVPEINDHMIVSTAKMALTAPRACVVCGLKRDERVKGVDVVVEDSFGEWWVEHWGHRACRNFWLGNEEKLRSR